MTANSILNLYHEVESKEDLTLEFFIKLRLDTILKSYNSSLDSCYDALSKIDIMKLIKELNNAGSY